MAGLRVLNNDGWVQIDSEHRNLRVVSSGTVTINQPILLNYPNATVGYSGMVQVPGAHMIAFRSDSYCAIHSSNKNSVDSSTQAFVFISSTPGATANWWAIGPGTTPSSNSGIRIFNSAGELVFDGSDRVPKMHGITPVLSAPFGSVTPITSSAPLLALAPLVNRTGWMAFGSPPAARIIGMAGARTTGASTAEATAVHIVAATGSDGSTSPPPGQWLLLDVSGL